MKLNVQAFLETKTFGQLAEKHGVNVRPSRHSHKFSLNYDQIMSSQGDRLAEECRGLVLSPVDKNVKIPQTKDELENFCPGDTEIMAFPFRRFYNSHEGHASNINWNDPELRVYEKLDGTLCIFYWDSVLNDWSVATRSMPDADLEITADSIIHKDLTFRKLFERGFENTIGAPLAASQTLLEPFKGKTLCFELTSPYNRVIVPYDRPEITLLMVRDNETGQESDPRLEPFPTAETFSLDTLEDVVAWANTLQAEESEGAVVTDSRYLRVKVKGINWIMANRVKSSVNTRRDCMELILRGSIDDYIKYVPEEARSAVETLKEKTASYLKKVEAAFWVVTQEATLEFNENIGDTGISAAEARKIFAKKVLATGLWTQPFFTWFDGRCNFGIKAYIDYLIETKNLKRSTLDSLLTLVDNDHS